MEEGFKCEWSDIVECVIIKSIVRLYIDGELKSTMETLFGDDIMAYQLSISNELFQDMMFNKYGAHKVNLEVGSKYPYTVGFKTMEDAEKAREWLEYTRMAKILGGI